MKTDIKILIAGIGNELRHDDGLGPTVLRRLMNHDFPKTIDLIDFGERIYDLLIKMGDYDIVIIVDALDMGGDPGEIYFIEQGEDMYTLDNINPHTIDLREIITLARKLWKNELKIFVLGCQPMDLSDGIGLSETVKNNVDKIVDIIKKVVSDYI